MRRFLTILILLAIIAGGVYLYGRSDAGKAILASGQPGAGGDVTGDVNVCVGSKDYCNGIAEAKNKEIENQQTQYELMLTQTAPTAAPTPSPEDIDRHNRQSDAKANAFVVFIYAAVALFVIGGILWFIWQTYWRFRIKGPRDEQAADIKEKNGLIVARLPGDGNHANIKDQWIAVDARSQGTQMLFIDQNDTVHRIALDPSVAPAVAMSHALAEMAHTRAAREIVAEFIDRWSSASASNIRAFGDAWGAARSHERTSRRSNRPAARPPHPGAQRMRRILSDGKQERGKKDGKWS